MLEELVNRYFGVVALLAGVLLSFMSSPWKKLNIIRIVLIATSGSICIGFLIYLSVYLICK